MTPSPTPPLPTIYQLRIVLRGVSPLVWRRLLVSCHTSLAHLHDILQIAFAWSGEHLYNFHIHGKDYGSHGADTSRIRLRDVRWQCGKRFRYVYNYFAGWACDIRLEAILACDPTRVYPICIEGQRVAPLAELLPERTTPELLFLESKWAALVAYGLSVKLLQDVLPIDEPLHGVTIRNHVLTLAQRLEDSLGEEQGCYIEGCPRDWGHLPIPDGPLMCRPMTTSPSVVSLSSSGPKGCRPISRLSFSRMGARRFEAQLASLVPNFTIGISGTMASPVSTFEIGGPAIAGGLRAYSEYLNQFASAFTYEATSNSILGSHYRRFDEWKLQEKLADKELGQIKKQILAAEIRLAIAEQEVKNHELQTENTRAVDDYLRRKYTSQELYDWMVSQTSMIYFQTYQLTYDLARRAEKAYRFERGVTTSSFIQFGYWDSLKQGLLSGEQVSLRLHDPLALIALKETGCCYMTLPEALFDVDYPGHYMRRIRSVSLIVPCVVGPYTSINCMLTLLGNKILVSSNAQADYHKQEDDPRFINNFAAVQSIATSNAQNDSGLFELNFRDERYLPFEGAGAVSEWRIDLPRECNAFDFETISDVIIKLSYTAREGGELLRKRAWSVATLRGPRAQQAHEPLGPAPSQEGLTRLYSVRHEFSGEWHRFLTPPDAASGQTLSVDLSKERFPFQYRGRDIHINQVELFLTFKSDDTMRVYREEGDALRVSLTPAGWDSGGGLAHQPAGVSQRCAPWADRRRGRWPGDLDVGCRRCRHCRHRGRSSL
jgi:Tc toxin complex TcA C-terminal TcB-binding domain/Plasmid pRiA4b ORF-3-like protein